MHRNYNYLDDHLKPEYSPRAPEENMVRGERFRFTILNPSLIRCEYNRKGRFIDEASQVVINREASTAQFSRRDEGRKLILETDEFLLTYRKEAAFSPLSLKILCKKNGKTWRYGSPDFQNLRGTRRTLDGAFGPVPLKKGILSRKGHFFLDDSRSLIFKGGWPEPRPSKGKDGYFFTYGRDFQKALNLFHFLTGKTPMIPRYILGNWWSRYYEYSHDSLLELMNRFEKEEIPLSVCIIDMDWHKVDIPKKYGSGWTGYSWNKSLFPDPEGTLRSLHEKNLKVSLNLHPARGIRAYEDMYEECADYMEVDKSREEPVRFDCTDPRFMKAYFQLVHHPHEEAGVDFWWIDWQQGRGSSVKGLDPLWMLNHLHFLDSGREKKRPFTFSRYSGPGAHRYPIGFSGDAAANWLTLNFQPYFTATASNMGYGWWSHDMGGHHFGKMDSELYLRWVQFGVFSPVNRLHSTKKEFHRREPWRHNKEVKDIASSFLRLRHQLIPYIYTAARDCHCFNKHLVQPLYYRYPHRKESYRYRNQYFFGPDMLVAPITKRRPRGLGLSRLKFWLPEGEWYCLFTGTKYEGDREYIRYYSLEEYPVFVKVGSIIPLAEYGSLNQSHNPENICLKVFPGPEGHYSLYEDQGENKGYEKGDYSETHFSMTQSDGSVEITITSPERKSWLPEERVYDIVLHGFDKGEAASLKLSGAVSEGTLTLRDDSLILSGIKIEYNCESRISIEGLIRKKNREDDLYERAHRLFDAAQGRTHGLSNQWSRLKKKKTAGAARIFIRLAPYMNKSLRRALAETFAEKREGEIFGKNS